MSLVCTHMPFVCHRYILVWYSYVTCMSFVCQLYVLVCHSYVTRMYSYIIRMSLVCTHTSSVCHSYVLVCRSYVTRMSFVCHSFMVLPWISSNENTAFRWYLKGCVSPFFHTLTTPLVLVIALLYLTVPSYGLLIIHSIMFLYLGSLQVYSVTITCY